jgi:hypothetical protein
VLVVPRHFELLGDGTRWLTQLASALYCNPNRHVAIAFAKMDKLLNEVLIKACGEENFDMQIRVSGNVPHGYADHSAKAPPKITTTLRYYNETDSFIANRNNTD